MEKFEVTILGCGSALPTLRHKPSAQIVNIHEKLFMVDCGEDAQVGFRRSKLNFNRLHAIFISHLHGDHCFGLIGLISTLSLLGRNADLHIYAEARLEEVLRPQIDCFCCGIEFDVVFHAINPYEHKVIYADRSVSISTLPLRHRVPCCGFLFKEAQSLPHIKREMIDFYNIPNCYINNIKLGASYTLPNGEIIENERLVTPAVPGRRYAYCSDTAFHAPLAELIEGADLLFHEATFAEEARHRAKQTCHSTASDAARMAHLAKVKRLVVGHYSARFDDETILEEAQKIFPQTIAANEGMKIEV